MIGVPGSGKSSLVRELQQQFSCGLISTDEIRAQLFGDQAIQGAWLLIWRQVERQFRQAVLQIQAGQIDWAIYDATNTRRRSRREVIALARSLGFGQITAVWLDPPLAICLQRNQQRSRQVPEAVIQRMHRQLWSCPPRLREGIDQLIHCNSTTACGIIAASRLNLPLQRVASRAAKSQTDASTEIAPNLPQEPNSIGL